MTKSKIQNPKSQIFILAFILAGILFGCQKARQVTQEKEAIPVRVEKVELKELDEALEYVGDIKAQDEAVVYPEVSGKIIEKTKVDGNSVAKDEAIAYIDRDEVGFKFEKAPIESPLAGVVGRVYVDIGQNVDLQTPIALVVDMDKVKINLNIPEKFLAKVSLGRTAKIVVDAYPEDEFQGIVTKISPVVDLSTRSSPVEITIDNPKHLLKSGMFAKVRLIVQENQKVPVILKEAIIGRGQDTYVYVIENKKAVLQKVSLGLRQGPYYEVLAGLKEGDLVAIMGQQRLSEGAQVILEEQNP